MLKGKTNAPILKTTFGTDTYCLANDIGHNFAPTIGKSKAAAKQVLFPITFLMVDKVSRHYHLWKAAGKERDEQGNCILPSALLDSDEDTHNRKHQRNYINVDDSSADGDSGSDGTAGAVRHRKDAKGKEVAPKKRKLGPKTSVVASVVSCFLQ